MTRLFVLVISCCLFFLQSLAQDPLEIVFSHTRGIYEDPFSLKMSLKGATIWYTLDGSPPQPGSANLYKRPIKIQSSAVIRAIGVSKTGDTSSVSTHTFLLPKAVIEQSDSLPGWPMRQVNTHYRGNPVRMTYGMDPTVAQDPLYKEDLLKGLGEIPSLALSMAVNDFVKVHFSDAELPVYLEILYPGDESEPEVAFAGLEGISHKDQKRSFRISFKKKYGDKNLKSQIFKDYDLLSGRSATDKFDQLVLRGGTQRSWARSYYPDETAFTRDQWYRDSQIALTGIGAHGVFVHLYINGVYMGLYNLTERPDEKFMASYFKGKDEEFHSFNHNKTLSGKEDRWDYLYDTLLQADILKPDVYREFQQYLDISAYFDYLIISWISGMGDWPENNFYGGYNFKRGTPMMFFGWDAEVALDEIPEKDFYEANPGAWVHPYFRSDEKPESEIDELWHFGRKNPDFLMDFADRVYLHCFDGGALTDSSQRTRWRYLNQFIRNAVVAESARWGDALSDSVTRTRDIHWQREVDRVDSMMQGNVARFLAALRAEGYYPTINPPSVQLQTDESGQEEVKIQLRNPNDGGEIYYRLDGGDPRGEAGILGIGAQLYKKEFTCKTGTTINARIKQGDEWSVLHVSLCP
ncbi:MAG: chitobiase/beta-hexosaminidase C-terminal domain-containing protein [Bacteroidota bacterium]